MAKRIRAEKDTTLDKTIRRQAPFFIWILALVVVFFAAYYLFQGNNKVEYQGLHFVMEKFGSILVYTYNYNIALSNGTIEPRTQYFRVDPRKNDVPVQGDIYFPPQKTVYVSINNTGINECSNSSIAVGNLAMFLANNEFVVKGGTPDKIIATEKNQTYVTCSNYPANTVILIESGNETKISSNGKYCNTIEVSNCEILQAVEKFMVQSVIDSKKTA